MLGWIRLKKNDLTTALEILRHAADKLPSSTVVKYHYGVALAASGDRAGAKRTLTECVELGERTPEALAAQKTLETL